MTRDSEPSAALQINVAARIAAAQASAVRFAIQFVVLPDHIGAIVVAARVDDLLHSAIGKRLLPSAGNPDELLTNDNPIGTFSARINLAFRLWLIDDSLRSALHIVRKIRNDFAHTADQQSFDQPPHLDRIRELETRLKTRGDYEHQAQLATDLFNKSQPQFVGISDNRKSYFVCIWTMITSLELLQLVSQPIDASIACQISYAANTH